MLNIRNQESKMIDRDENVVFNGLGNDWQMRVGEYRRQMQESIKQKELDAIQVTTRKGGDYVSSKFREQFNKLLPNKRSRGRPRKELIVSV